MNFNPIQITKTLKSSDAHQTTVTRFQKIFILSNEGEKAEEWKQK